MSVEKNSKEVMERYLSELRLPGVRGHYEEMLRLAVKESLGYEDFLLSLLEVEIEQRNQNRVRRLLRMSKLPEEKRFDNFEFKRLPARVCQQIRSLMVGDFVDRKENVLVFGNPGSGKTHLLCALGHELVNRSRRVLFVRSSTMIQELLRARKELRLPRVFKKLSRYEAIILDDIGYVQQDRDEMEVLFNLISERYERGSLLISSNLAFSKWESIFKSPMLAEAAIDRLVHHAIVIELNLESYRMEQALKGKKWGKASMIKKEVKNGSER